VTGRRARATVSHVGLGSHGKWLMIKCGREGRTLRLGVSRHGRESDSVLWPARFGGVVICGPLPPVVTCQQERLYLLFYRDCSVLAIHRMGCEAQQASPVEEVGKV
jgi:hypothetical protein